MKLIQTLRNRSANHNNNRTKTLTFPCGALITIIVTRNLIKFKIETMMASDDEVSLDVIEMNRVNDAVGSNVFDNDVTAVAVRLSEETQQTLAVVEEKRSKIVAYFVTTLLFTAFIGLTVVLLLSQSPFPSTKETDYASDVSYFDSLFD